ncbi:MAG: SH3 domain-containing protein [Pseudomonadota bacterium]
MDKRSPTLKIASLSLAVALSACQGGGNFNPLADASVNYASGSALGVQLPSKDQAALEPVFLQAVARGASGERFDWRGPDSFGWVKVRDHVVGNVKPSRHDRPVAPKEVDLSFPMETELGLYALTRNSNVRAGPSTEYPVLAELVSGDGIDGVGRVVGKPWILAEKDGRVVGYIHENLMVKAPGTELLLAGGPTKTPMKCREFEQRISYTGRSDRWEGVACLEDGRWVLQPEDNTKPVQLY